MGQGGCFGFLRRDGAEIIASDNSLETNAREFSLPELEDATLSFKDNLLIREDGLGKVYGANLILGQWIAVRVLINHGMQDQGGFLNEIRRLSLLHHDSLVDVVGYCCEGHHRIIVYDFIRSASLEKRLHGCKSPEKLDDPKPVMEPLAWPTRLKIAAAVAKGLNYLHNEANPPVVFGDLKSRNVLLYDRYGAKLYDFGLAKFVPEPGTTDVSTRVMGTLGYCAPECAATGTLTFQSDVYSFGVVLLEIFTGQKALDETRGEGMNFLADWALDKFRNEDVVEIAAAERQFSRGWTIRGDSIGITVHPT